MTSQSSDNNTHDKPSSHAARVAPSNCTATVHHVQQKDILSFPLTSLSSKTHHRLTPLETDFRAFTHPALVVVALRPSVDTFTADAVLVPSSVNENDAPRDFTGIGKETSAHTGSMVATCDLWSVQAKRMSDKNCPT
jgi:hypothetical protein